MIQKNNKNNQERNFINSLARGLSILEAFDPACPKLGISELARKTGLSKSTVYRFVFTLCRLGYIIPVEESNKYTLGPKVLALGFDVLASLELREIAQPYLMDLSRQVKETVNLAVLDGWSLSRQVKETVNLAVLDGWRLIYIERIKTEQIVNINLHVGSRLELYNTAMGRVLAAFQDKKWLSQYLKYIKKFPEAKDYWKNNGQKVLNILEEVRRLDYAINNEELTPGLRSVATPIRNREGKVVAAVNIAVSSSLYSLTRLKKVLIPPLQKTTQAISSALGYKFNLKNIR